MSNPIIEYFNYAEKKKVHVREYVRKTKDGTTVVDAHDRIEEGGADEAAQLLCIGTAT